MSKTNPVLAATSIKTWNAFIKKAKTNLEKPLKPKKATDEKNTPKKSLKKKKRKTSNVTK